ncbi:MAG: hypothetical protein ABSD58_09215 [Verrucomicrobiia bacterium]|jgi:hypothetical protein
MKNPVTIILSVAVVVVSAGAALLYSQTQKLQSANSKLTVQLADVNSELEAANQEIAQMKPDVERARAMPIMITLFRFPGFHTGREYYDSIIFHNTSPKPLALHVTLSNPASSKRMELPLVIDGGKRKGIRSSDGWSGSEGDVVKVECAGYDPIEKSIR